MPELDTGLIIAIVAGSVLVILLVIFFITTLVLMKKKRVLCFRRKRSEARPFLLSGKELEKRHGRWKRKSKPPSKKTKKNKSYKYNTLSRGLKFPKSDPFAGKQLDNPMINMDDFDVDWTNPAFDMEGAQIRDAAVVIQAWYRMIRVRIPYMQLREATILTQALYRGLKARAMLPRLRKEKSQRDQLRKKQAGWKKQGKLDAMKYFDVKAFGFAEVEQLYGMETVRDAAHQLKNLYGGRGKMRLKLFISVKGIKLYHYQTMEHFATVKVSTVSFCTLDPRNRKVFAFINRKKRKNFCHVFQASESDAQKMVETMAEAFEVTFRRLETKRKNKERQMELDVKRATFNRQSQQLDDEVASMLEMAETASSTLLLDKQRLSEVSSDDGSIGGSREKLLSSSPNQLRQQHRRNNRAVVSGLTTSLKASLPPSNASDEPVDSRKSDESYTGVIPKERVDSNTPLLETGNRRSILVGQMVEKFS